MNIIGQWRFFMSEYLEELKKRSLRCVCKYCGGELEIKKITSSQAEDGQLELVCLNCDRIESGVESEIYHAAVYFVEEYDYNCYCELENNEQRKRLNVSNICEILTWGFRELNLLDEKGFSTTINQNIKRSRHAVVFSDNDLT